MEQQVRYAGFGRRLVAQVVDTVLATAAVVPLLYALYGKGFLDPARLAADPLNYLLSHQPQTGPLEAVVSYGLPALAIIVFWMTRQATPGKMLVGARLVDAASLGKISAGQALGRYLGYYACLLSLGLGFAWIIWDPRKQGWHDKLARTLVIRDPAR